MTCILGILTVCSALAATGYTLLCTDCSEHNTNTCSGSSVTCSVPGEVCATTFSETSNEAEASSTITRRCQPPFECNFKGNFLVTQIKFRTATTCCSTDNCTPPVPTLLSNNSELNGLVCPSCYGGDPTVCDTSVTVQCRGPMNRCLLATQKQADGAIYFTAACATQTYCDLGLQVDNVSGTTSEINYECSGGT